MAIPRPGKLRRKGSAGCQEVAGIPGLEARAVLSLRAFRNEGLHAGVYFSAPDWHNMDYEDPKYPMHRMFEPNYPSKENPEKWQRFLDFMHSQVEELVTGYGPLDILWLDGAGEDDYQFPKLARKARGHQPGMLFVARAKGDPFEDYRTPEQSFPDKALPYPWETCMTMGDFWAYNPHDYYKPARELIQLFVDIVAKGGNLLLDIGPDANGQICYTRKGESAFVIYLAENGRAKPPRFVYSDIVPADGAKVNFLGYDVDLNWKMKGNQAEIEIPDSISNRLRGLFAYTRHAWSIRISKVNIPND